MFYESEEAEKLSKGLYIHIPFCVKKCRYCDFVSFCQSDKYFDRYIESLLLEAEEYKGESIDTVFIGGGTPSILSSSQLEKLLIGITDCFKIDKDAEFSVESNPKTLDKDKLLTLKKFGVNRISLGVQSFSDNELKAIGRIHNAFEAEKTARLIKDMGGFKLNLDIMLSLPYQNEDSLLKTLKKAESLEPEHLSCYSLIIEELTPLYDDYKSGKFNDIDDEYDRKMYRMCVEYLKENGYNRYEISNFARGMNKCQHNLKYWNCEEYIGLGVAAHSFLGNVRSFNTSDLEKYLSGSFHEEEKTILSKEDKISEYIIMRLRLSDGVLKEQFYERFGLDFEKIYKSQIDKLIASGLMAHEGGRYFLTDLGIDLSNTAMCEFV